MFSAIYSKTLVKTRNSQDNKKKKDSKNNASAPSINKNRFKKTLSMDKVTLSKDAPSIVEDRLSANFIDRPKYIPSFGEPFVVRFNPSDISLITAHVTNKFDVRSEAINLWRLMNALASYSFRALEIVILLSTTLVYF